MFSSADDSSRIPAGWLLRTQGLSMAALALQWQNTCQHVPSTCKALYLNTAPQFSKMWFVKFFIYKLLISLSEVKISSGYFSSLKVVVNLNHSPNHKLISGAGERWEKVQPEKVKILKTCILEDGAWKWVGPEEAAEGARLLQEKLQKLNLGQWKAVSSSLQFRDSWPPSPLPLSTTIY